MTVTQRIQIRQSEIRQRLNELASPEAESTDETRSEIDTLMAEISSLEVKLRAAITAEQEEIEARNDGNPETSDPRLDDLRQRATVSEYIRQAINGQPLDGACRELNDALGITAVRGQGGGALMPVEQLAFRAANTTSTAGDADETQRRPIFSRLFARSVMEALGVRLDSVPIGMIEYPILTDASDPAMTAEDTDVGEPDAATWSSQVLKPKRLISSYEFTAEAVATVPGLDAALSSDLQMSMSSQMDKEILTGDGTGANVRGLDTAINFAGLTNPSAIVSQTTALGWGLAGVDGLHASSEADCSIVIGPETYRKVAAILFEGTTENAFDVLRRRGTTVVTSAHVAKMDNATKIQKGYIHAGRDMARGDSISGIWPGMELIRDPYTKAASSKTIITAVMLWDAWCGFRAAAYKGIEAKLEA